MKVKVKKIAEAAKIPFKKFNDDFCYDCVATSCKEIAPNIYKYGIGLAFQIDRDKESPFAIVLKRNSFEQRYEPWQLSIDARPRSSVWEHGMVLSNCEGTINKKGV